MSANSHLDTLICTIFELQLYGSQDETEQWSNARNKWIESFNSCNEIRELCDGTKRFAVRVNKVSQENRSIIKGALYYALIQRNQLANRSRKEFLFL